MRSMLKMLVFACLSCAKTANSAHLQVKLSKQQEIADIVALKSMYPLLNLLCTNISSCGCAER